MAVCDEKRKNEKLCRCGRARVKGLKSCAECRERHAECKRNLKRQVLRAYGNGKEECVGCGERELAVLSIDHINNDGGKERKRRGGKGGVEIYLEWKKEGWPNDPPKQVLCMNCQFRKRQRVPFPNQVYMG
jgi:hypothetical protein